MKGSATAPAARAPLFTFSLIALSGLTFLSPSTFELSRRGVADGEFWRLLTGHLCHYSLYHFAVDAGTLLALGWIVESRRGARRWGLLAASSAIAISLAFIWAEPQLDVYRGLSGIDCAAFAAALALKIERHRAPALALAAVFAAKLAYEQLTGRFLFPSADLGEMGLPVLTAHTVGALTGFASAIPLPKESDILRGCLGRRS
jgi:rhomboid family GlyGly-CTERM serine protease